MPKMFKIACFRGFQRVPRQLSVAPHVDAIGDLHEKRQWESRVFHTCAFSFILRGEGEYRMRGKTWRINAPCVLTQVPGEAIEYGPDGEWDEVFLAYPREWFRFFRDGGLLLGDRPVWQIRSVDAVRAGLRELFRLLDQGEAKRVIDSVDAMCLRILTDSLLHPPAQLSASEKAIRRVRTAVDDDLFARWTTRNLARQANMSTSTFRRHWLSSVGAPPQQYIIERKIDMACQLLLHSDLRSGEVAQALHFENYFYFSRLFKQKTGLSPTAFRQRGAGNPGSS